MDTSLGDRVQEINCFTSEEEDDLSLSDLPLDNGGQQLLVHDHDNQDQDTEFEFQFETYNEEEDGRRLCDADEVFFKGRIVPLITSSSFASSSSSSSSLSSSSCSSSSSCPSSSSSSSSLSSCCCCSCSSSCSSSSSSPSLIKRSSSERFVNKTPGDIWISSSSTGIHSSSSDSTTVFNNSFFSSHRSPPPPELRRRKNVGGGGARRSTGSIPPGWPAIFCLGFPHQAITPAALSAPLPAPEMMTTTTTDKKKKPSFLLRGFSCRCASDVVETMVFKKEDEGVGFSIMKRGESVGRHGNSNSRLFEWLEEL